MIKLKKRHNLLLNHRFIFDGPDETPAQAQTEKPDGKEVKEGGKTERANLADKKAQETTTTPETDKETPAGKVHKTYFEKTEAIKEEDAEKDREKLRNEEIKNIRFNSRLLKPKGDKEDEATQASSLKEETQKRIKAYTDKADKDWYVLNYQRLGSDKKGRTHEMNVGLGDILIDTDIKEILVKKKSGEVIKAHRGTVPGRQMYAGRQAFLDENNSYVDTYTGDSFRILSNEETDLKNPAALKKYLEEFSTEEKVREENSKHFEEEMALGTTALLDFNREKNKNAKPLSDEEIVKRLNNKREEKDGESLLSYGKEVCEKFGIPFSVYKELINIESGWSPNAAYKGPVHSDASGLGQFLGSTWTSFMKYCASNDIHEEKWGPKPMTQDTRFNPYACLYATAWLMGQTKKAFADFDKKNIAEQGSIYYICHHEGLAGGKKFLRATSEGNCPKTEVLALANRVAYRASISEGFDIESLQKDEIAEIIDNGKEGANGKGIIKLKSNQDAWIFGSSSVVGLNGTKDKLGLRNVGFFGIVGINSGNFYKKLVENWDRIKALKLPPQVILMGMASNGLGNSDESVRENLENYSKIKTLLESRGTKITVATVQPSEKNGEGVKKFNDELRKTYGENCIDVAKYTTTPDGTTIIPEYAAQYGHLKGEGAKILDRMVVKAIKEGAEKERTA